MCSSVLLTHTWFAARKRWRLRSMNTQRPCVRMLMDFRCCPACMYSLAGQEIETDGCTVCPECGGAKKRIGEETSEQLEYVPASLFVIEHVRPKYACPCCQAHVSVGVKPAQPIEQFFGSHALGPL